MSTSAVELGFLDDYLGLRVLVFVNVIWTSSTLCTLKISASAVELRFEDEFWDTGDSFFVNGLSVSSSLFAQKMSASAVELGFLDDYLGPRVLVFVNGFWASSTLCRLGQHGLSFHQRFVWQEYFICEEDVSVSRRTGLLGWFLGPRDLVFINGVWGSSSLCGLKISESAVELVLRMIFGTAGTQFSSTVCLSGVVYLSRRCQRQP
jgi:hypothetical protein